MQHCPERRRPLCAKKGERKPVPRPPKKTPFIGIQSVGMKWRAKICIETRVHIIGIYDTAIEAARAYDAMARANPYRRGKPRLLNFDQEPEGWMSGTPLDMKCVHFFRLLHSYNCHSYYNAQIEKTKLQSNENTNGAHTPSKLQD